MPENVLTPVKDDESFCRSTLWVRDTLAICCGAMVTFVIGLPQEFIGLDSRYALFAKEMLRNGPSFFPTAFNAVYADYPATTVLPIVWLSSINGAVTPLTAVLPTAAVSCGILVFTYLVGSLHSRKWGLGAVCMCFLTLAFLHAARSVSPDQWTSLATIACFYLVYSSHVLGRRKRLGWIPVFLIFGFAGRGPIGLIIPTSAVLTLCLCTRQFKSAALWAALGALTLAVGSWALLAAAEHQGGADFAQRVWDMQVAGRLTRGGRGPAYYWLTAWGSYAFTFPIAVLVIVSLWRWIIQRHSADTRLLFSLSMCAVVVLTGMSIPAEKKARYVLSIVPFIALVASYTLALPDSKVVLSRVHKIVTLGCVTLPWISGSACALRALLVVFGTLPGEIYALRTGVCTILATVLAFYISVRSRYVAVKSLPALAACAASAVILYVGVIEPSLWAKKGSRMFVQRIEKRCALPNKPIVFYRLGPDQEDIVLAANMREPFQPRFVESVSSLLRVPPSTCIITDEDALSDLSTAVSLKVQTLEAGTLGGTRVALFRIKENTH